MNVLFYFVGLLIGIAVFFYFLSLYHSGADRLAARRAGDREEIDAAQVRLRDAQAYPRERVCPLCRAVLTKDEVLYASRVNVADGSKIIIHGCRYCYLPTDSGAAAGGTTPGNPPAADG